MNSDRLKYLIAANKRFCAIGAMEVQSSAVHIPASYSADGILPGSCANNQLLIINLASVQDGQLVNSPTAQSLERLAAILSEALCRQNQE